MARKAMSLEELTKQSSEHFLNALSGQSDLACALIITTFLENALMTVLEGFLVKCDTSKNMFKEGNILGDFGKCISMAYCLGIISDPMRHNLDLIGKIRNRFAHTPGGIDFNTPEIKALCLDFYIHKGSVNTLLRPLEEVPETESKAFFSIISLIIFCQLALMSPNIQHQTLREQYYNVEWSNKKVKDR